MEKKHKNFIQICILIIISIMILNITIFSFQNSLINFSSDQKTGVISINDERVLFFDDAYAKKNIEWEIKSTCPITLEIMTYSDYFTLTTMPLELAEAAGWDFNYIRLFTNCYEHSGIIELDEPDSYYFLFDSNGSGTIEYNIKFDSVYFNFIWIFYTILVIFIIIGVISIKINTSNKINDLSKLKFNNVKFITHSEENKKLIHQCTNCKNRLDDKFDKNYCPYCGTVRYKTIDTYNDDFMVFCKQCGNKLRKNTDFCHICGFNSKLIKME